MHFLYNRRQLIAEKYCYGKKKVNQVSIFLLFVQSSCKCAIDYKLKKKEYSAVHCTAVSL